MKVFVLTQDLSGNGQVWMNVLWPHYNAIAESVPTEVIALPNNTGDIPWYRKVRRRLKRMTGRTPEATEQQLRSEGLSGSNSAKFDGRTIRTTIDTVRARLDPQGPNILIVWALRYSDVERAARLLSVWDGFDFKVLSVVDNLSLANVKDLIDGRFDLITSFCGDLAREFGEATKIPTLYFPPHTDVLNFAEPGPYRPIDFFVVGRRTPAIHTPLHLHYNRPGSNRLSVDFVSRTVSASYPRDVEFQYLMSAYGRSKMAFCFEASAVQRFKNRSPLTERWVHAWASGCTVIGTRAKGAGVEGATDWPDAMIDLPAEPEAAREMTDSLLDDEAGLAERRLRNVEEAMRRHDTRLRLAQILETLDIARPDSLNDRLAELVARADALARTRENG